MLGGSIGAVLFIRSQLLLPMISIRVSLLVSCLFLPALVACSEDRADPPQRSDASSEERVSGDGPGSKAPPRNSASGDDTVATSPDTSLTDGGISVVDSSDVGETTSPDSMDVSIADPDVTMSGDETADVVTSGEQATELSSDAEDSTSDAETIEPPRPVDYLPCDVEVILAARCRVCHSRTSVGEQPLLDTYAQVRAEAPWIVDTVLDDFMPQLPPPLTDTQKATLVDWLEAGTPAVRQMAAPVCVQ
jgi:hypothetical protein